MPGPFYASLILNCPSCGTETYRSEVEGTPEVVERWRAEHERIARGHPARPGRPWQPRMAQECPACSARLELAHDESHGADVTDARGEPARDREGKPVNVRHGARLRVRPDPASAGPAIPAPKEKTS